MGEHKKPISVGGNAELSAPALKTATHPNFIGPTQQRQSPGLMQALSLPLLNRKLK
jgi:hypothetical protein